MPPPQRPRLLQLFNYAYSRAELDRLYTIYSTEKVHIFKHLSFLRIASIYIAENVYYQERTFKLEYIEGIPMDIAENTYIYTYTNTNTYINDNI